MPDMDKVIKAIDICLGHGKCDDCGYRIKGGYSTMDCRKPMLRDALVLLKEQEEHEKKICKTICNFIRGSCSTDTYADKEFVCHEIQKCFMKGR